MATYVYANNRGQRTHSARTNNRLNLPIKNVSDIYKYKNIPQKLKLSTKCKNCKVAAGYERQLWSTKYDDLVFI